MAVELHFIYALHTGDDNYFYVGRSRNPKGRLKRHIRDADPDGTAKERHIYQLLEDGEEITYTILESGIHVSEDTWKVNLQAEGYELFNSKEGDTETYTYTPNESLIKTPWSHELFDNADWDNDYFKCKSTEKGCCIKGVSFYRTGKRKLRFHHPKHGEQIVEGMKWEDKVARAIAMLTPGTPEHQKMIEDNERARRLAPSKYK